MLGLLITRFLGNKRNPGNRPDLGTKNCWTQVRSSLSTSAGVPDYPMILPGSLERKPGAGDGIKSVSWDSQPHRVRGRQGNKINAYKELQEAKSIPSHARYWLWGWRPICSLNQYLLAYFIGQALCQVLGLVLGTGLRISHFLIFPLSSGVRIGMTSGSHWRKDCTGLRLREADISFGTELRLGIAWSG